MNRDDARPLPAPARVGLAAAVLAGVVVTAVTADPSGLLFFLAYAGIGGYLAVRRPANAVGWFLVLTGFGLGLGSIRPDASPATLVAGGLAPLQTTAIWFSGWGWGLAFIGFFGVCLTFPRGALPGGRGRRTSRFALGLMGVLILLLAFGPTVSVDVGTTGSSIDVRNPFALFPDADWWGGLPPPDALYAAMFVIFAASVAVLIGRSRRSVGVERLQFRWLVAAIAFVAASSAVWAVLTLALDADPAGLAWLLVVISYPCVPIAIAIAVLRYRLFEIDRIISRTIAYAAISVVVGAVFALGIVILSSVLGSFAQGETIAIAGATLAAYGIVQPAHRRIRRAVDRRFDRARYDANTTMTTFSRRLRLETDLPAISMELASIVTATVAPSSMALWLRDRDLRR